jgi:hypothetical protein
MPALVPLLRRYETTKSDGSICQLEYYIISAYFFFFLLMRYSVGGMYAKDSRWWKEKTRKLFYMNFYPLAVVRTTQELLSKY